MFPVTLCLLGLWLCQGCCCSSISLKCSCIPCTGIAPRVADGLRQLPLGLSANQRSVSVPVTAVADMQADASCLAWRIPSTAAKMYGTGHS